MWEFQKQKNKLYIFKYQKSDLQSAIIDLNCYAREVITLATVTTVAETV